MKRGANAAVTSGSVAAGGVFRKKQEIKRLGYGDDPPSQFGHHQDRFAGITNGTAVPPDAIRVSSCKPLPAHVAPLVVKVTPSLGATG